MSEPGSRGERPSNHRRADYFLSALPRLTPQALPVQQAEKGGAVAQEETSEFPPLPVTNRAIDAPTVYADSCYFMTSLSGAVRLHFHEAQADPSDAPDPGWKSKYVTTVVMTAPNFLETLKYMNDTAAKMIADGRLRAAG